MFNWCWWNLFKMHWMKSIVTSRLYLTVLGLWCSGFNLLAHSRTATKTGDGSFISVLHVQIGAHFFYTLLTQLFVHPESEWNWFRFSKESATNFTIKSPLTFKGKACKSFSTFFFRFERSVVVLSGPELKFHDKLVNIFENRTVVPYLCRTSCSQNTTAPNSRKNLQQPKRVLGDNVLRFNIVSHCMTNISSQQVAHLAECTHLTTRRHKCLPNMRCFLCLTAQSISPVSLPLVLCSCTFRIDCLLSNTSHLLK